MDYTTYSDEYVTYTSHKSKPQYDMGKAFLGLLSRVYKVFSRFSQKDDSFQSAVVGYTAQKKAFRMRKVAKLLFVIGVVFLAVYYLPVGFDKIFPGRANEQVASAFDESEITSKGYQPEYQPEYDESLPVENTLIIDSVGIDTPIYAASLDSYENALKKGVWRVGNFGTPHDRELPTILAAHRYGYLKWSVSYRLKNSFYNLPKTKIGDRVDIVWWQRKYTYEIYAESTGDKIEDYSADLILYTCRDLSSDVRYFRYARLVEG